MAFLFIWTSYKQLLDINFMSSPDFIILIKKNYVFRVVQVFFSSFLLCFAVSTSPSIITSNQLTYCSFSHPEFRVRRTHLFIVFPHLQYPRILLALSLPCSSLIARLH